MKIVRTIAVLAQILLAVCAAKGQIKLQNPSFEGLPQENEPPAGWGICNAGSSPDVQPGVWGVTLPAADGNSYVGLTTRADGTVEDLTQKLNQPLRTNECYEMSLKLARSSVYAGFRLPVRLRVWGSTSPCERTELLATTRLVKNTTWETFKLSFYIKENAYQYLIFEPYYGAGVRQPYKGNLLLDDCSELHRCPRALRQSKARKKRFF